MKAILFVLLLAGSTAYAQKDTPLPPVKPIKTQYMNTDKLTHPIVKKAIDALQAADRNTWFAQFTEDAELYDDGNKMNLRSFFDKAMGHERFTSIDKVENKGLDVYGHFHSDQWGDFKTYFKFKVNGSGKVERLDIGQANY
ncbi:hypothetical protein F0L74_08490 [Chitinophaga agrisoli]|uniref:SnoaL-like protein n=1 Tax=Chitinophaga agrisoli TaxID=2607653 RepID=A0A5B2VS30_9BACT|nr:hypothetical protein [Chitinophaga agrisoli]KAA2242563.1 hypothetical protein F0L74_08490 [Chitinophaga agrisoli]